MKPKAALLSTLLFLLLASTSASAFYDPGTQRWLTRDPLGEAGAESIRPSAQSAGSLIPAEVRETPSLYSFTRNQPVLRVDVDGLFMCCVPVKCPPQHNFVECVMICAKAKKGIPIGPPLCLFCVDWDAPKAFLWLGCPCSKNLFPW